MFGSTAFAINVLAAPAKFDAVFTSLTRVQRSMPYLSQYALGIEGAEGLAQIGNLEECVR